MFKLRAIQKRKQEQCIAANNLSADKSHYTSAARLRLRNDLDSLELPPFVKMNPVNSSERDSPKLPVLQFIISPDEGFYKGGNFTFNVEFNENYPIESPTVRCLNKIFHPNIDTEGKICLNILREDWSPALDLQSIIIGLIFLFLEVDPKDPLNQFAADILSKDENEFAEFARRAMSGGLIEGVRYDFVL